MYEEDGGTLITTVVEIESAGVKVEEPGLEAGASDVLGN